MAEDTHDILRDLVNRITCKPGWILSLKDDDGALRLVIRVFGPDSTKPDSRIRIAHLFPVPTATYNFKTWRRWVFDCCLKVENHEMSEWFRVDDIRPFPPLHGPGEDPFIIHEFREESDSRIMQDGTVVDKLY